MQVQCRSNDISVVPNKYRKYAFTQDDSGKIDTTVGRQYAVYGIREFDGMTYYLVPTDSIHSDAPWWMPGFLYEVVDDLIPKTWAERKRGIIKKDIIIAPPSYHNHENEIEDGGSEAAEIFAQMRKESGY